MTTPFTESTAEEAALTWFEELGYSVLAGPDIAPGEPAAERASFEQVVLLGRLRDAVGRLNPAIPAEAIEEVVRKITRPEAPWLVHVNHTVHAQLVNGVSVEYTRKDGSTAHDLARLVDPDRPDQNDWLAVNQFTVVEAGANRRPDIVVFVNGLPLAVIELKNPTDENATIWSAFNQLQTYKNQIPSLFYYNEALVVSDLLAARIGSLTADGCGSRTEQVRREP